LIKSVYKYSTILTAIFFLVVFSFESKAQDGQDDPYRDVVQFSGVVLGNDSINGLPGVHIYVPKAGRGTTSNPYGYFSVPLLKGDSVIVSAIGFEKLSMIVPGDQGNSVSVIIELAEDTTYLQEIEIFPYPTEELFKEAILALELPYAEDLNNLDAVIGQDVLDRAYYQLEPSASANHRYFTEQQFRYAQTRFQIPGISLLDPIAWSKFIQSIKRGDLKNKNKKKKRNKR